MRAMTDLAKGAEKASATIPDLYYDLIARVVPGTAVLSYLVYVLNPPAWERWMQESSIWLLLVGGYVLGMILVSIAWPVFNAIWRAVYRRSDQAWDRSILIAKLDRSLDEDPELGKRLWKSYAEMAAAEALVLGFAVTAIWELTKLWRAAAVTWPFCAGRCALLVALIVVLYTRVTIVRERSARVRPTTPTIDATRHAA